jgi:hypothetical protein
MTLGIWSTGLRRAARFHDLFLVVIYTMALKRGSRRTS